MTNIIRALSAAALAGGLAIGLAASAEARQDRPPPGDQAAWGRQGEPGDMRARFEARHQRRQQVLHDALGLRADQEGAWQAFVASAHGPRGERGPGERRGEGGEGQRAELTTPERLDRMAHRMAERQARFAQRAEATKRFYAALDQRQQRTFDALGMARRGHMGGFGRHGMGPAGPGGPPPGPDGERG